MLMTDGADRVQGAGPDEAAEALVSQLAAFVDGELLLMKKTLGPDGDEKDFRALEAELSLCLRTLKELIDGGQIHPWEHVRLSPDEPESPPPPSGERPLRLGLFPTSANPLHWMHLLGGLLAICRFHLDKVVYIIASNDPRKEHLLPATVRHRLGQKVLQAFSPFLAYSAISLGGSQPGEVNAFRLLQLNSRRKIQAFYLAGTDHCRRCDPTTGEPDTIQRLEDGVRGKLFGFDKTKNSLSMVFLDRGDPPRPVESFLEMKRIGPLPFTMSSTLARDALSGRCPPRVLAGLPFTVFTTACALGLWGASIPALWGAHALSRLPRTGPQLDQGPVTPSLTESYAHV